MGLDEICMKKYWRIGLLSGGLALSSLGLLNCGETKEPRKAEVEYPEVVEDTGKLFEVKDTYDGGCLDRIIHSDKTPDIFCVEGEQKTSYSGPQETKGAGICQSKIEECKEGGFIIVREEILPQIEDCFNLLDDNCNGVIDDCCLCCPSTVISSKEGDEIIEDTILHLDGLKSYSDCGCDIIKWEWELEKPENSTTKIEPSLNSPEITAKVDELGLYTFYLMVWDELGIPSCYPESYEVQVFPVSPIEIELRWYLQDGEEMPSIKDLDLHFLHPMASGPDLNEDGIIESWFDPKYDCFWFNKAPDWGTNGQYVPPMFNEEKFESKYEEKIRYFPLDNSSADGIYRIGVHYWDDHGYGLANAFVKVYFYGLPLLETELDGMKMNELWEVATIEWPTGKTYEPKCPDGDYNIWASYLAIGSDTMYPYGDLYPLDLSGAVNSCDEAK